ncbi:MAG: hypothetical protein QF752_11735 [Planctomycetota bacterium]|jgi:hypothetical protein|nr:hypothetical protein [Planctomycetota bacterium]
MKSRRRLPRPTLGVTFSSLYCILLILFSLQLFPVVVFPLLVTLLLLMAGNVNAWMTLRFMGFLIGIPLTLISLGDLIWGSGLHISWSNLVQQCLLGWMPVVMFFSLSTKKTREYFDMKCRHCLSYHIRCSGIFRPQMQCRDCLESWRAQSIDVDTEAFD